MTVSPAENSFLSVISSHSSPLLMLMQTPQTIEQKPLKLLQCWSQFVLVSLFFLFVFVIFFYFMAVVKHWKWWNHRAQVCLVSPSKAHWHCHSSNLLVFTPEPCWWKPAIMSRFFWGFLFYVQYVKSLLLKLYFWIDKKRKEQQPSNMKQKRKHVLQLHYLEYCNVMQRLNQKDTKESFQHRSHRSNINEWWSKHSIILIHNSFSVKDILLSLFFKR